MNLIWPSDFILLQKTSYKEVDVEDDVAKEEYDDEDIDLDDVNSEILTTLTRFMYSTDSK